ncbi:diacylglycerol kinase family protein [Cryobacterium sp. SO2]|uniref:diacylglycerol/lipid kinase family protein n=1 Tax=Cryobacterium sp. SO2 TaxID=1897060 RepID=UPI00223D41AA|nr:diacylglycerol kinase family protein [Cryobacterium sp. SO2]WEO77660.1 diacylglycerol kinase family protein [Cryobacterium sp. SO2]
MQPSSSASESTSSDDSPAERRAAVIYNPVKTDAVRLMAGVTAVAEAAGWAETLWFETSVADPGQRVTRQALRHGVDLVLVAGGDGTVRAVAESLRASEVPLGVLPVGTGNLLARNLQLPLNSLDDAIGIAFTGDTKAIDLGVASVTFPDERIDDHVFLVMAGLGLDAQMIAATRPDLKKQVGWLAYVDAGMRAIPKAEPFRIRYNLGTRSEHQATVSTILIANCGLLPGNIQFLPDALIDDGILDIAVLQPKGFLGWLKIWRRVTWQNGVLRRSAVGRRIIELTETDNERAMTTLLGTDIRIVPEKPQEFELDGDEFGLVKSVFLRADAGALLVRVPAARQVSAA